MKNNIDYIYEYSDLNLFNTRVQILTGEYSGIILEYGASHLAQWEDNNQFTFEYILYELPEGFQNSVLRADKKFNKFLAYLLVDIIKDRKKDKKAKEKLDAAASEYGKTNSDIKISDKWYPDK